MPQMALGRSVTQTDLAEKKIEILLNKKCPGLITEECDVSSIIWDSRLNETEILEQLTTYDWLFVFNDPDDLREMNIIGAETPRDIFERIADADIDLKAPWIIAIYHNGKKLEGVSNIVITVFEDDVEHNAVSSTEIGKLFEERSDYEVADAEEDDESEFEIEYYCPECGEQQETEPEEGSFCTAGCSYVFTNDDL